MRPRSKPEISRHYILRRMGLIETLCFQETNENAWWFVKDDVITFMLLSPRSRRK